MIILTENTVEWLETFHAPEMGADKELTPAVSAYYQSTLKHSCNFGESSLSHLKGDVYLSISEPDPSQLVLCNCFHGKFAGYYDEIPQLYNLFGILIVVFAIIATPLSLLCFIPAMEYMKKVSYNIIAGYISVCEHIRKYMHHSKKDIHLSLSYVV